MLFACAPPLETTPPPAARGSGEDLLSPAAWTVIGRSLRLSCRELQIVRGIFNNLTEAAMGDQLGISGHTVHIHLNRLFKKVHSRTRVEVVLRVFSELLRLTLSDGGVLPAICRERVGGRCGMTRPKSCLQQEAP